MICLVYIGDFVKRPGSDQYLEVVDIIDNMTVELSDGSSCIADDNHMSDLKSNAEYKQMVA